MTFNPSYVGKQITVVDGVQFSDAPYAYHRVPAGTALHKQLPEAYMITNTERYTSVTSGLLPADPQTAENCISYLAEYAESQVSTDRLIEQFAKQEGYWLCVSHGEVI